MTIAGWAEILAFCAVLIVLSPLLGGYMAKVYTGQRVFLTPLFARPERFLLPRASASIPSASRTGRATPRA